MISTPTDRATSGFPCGGPRATLADAMRVHGSCAARDGAGVLLIGPPGSGKSELVLRLRMHGFVLVADDWVEILHGMARPPASLAGLLEVRGLGILRMEHTQQARLHLLVRLGMDADRLPLPQRDAGLDLPVLCLDAARPAAADRVALALSCALGEVASVAGAFAPA